MSTAPTATDSTLEMVKYAMIDIEVLEDMNPSGMSIIYTVPSNLRKMDEEAFTPQLISIGPIHFGKQHLKEMQKLKYSYFQVFWKRSSNEETMNQYKDFLTCRIKDIRECYENKFPEISDEQFVEIVLLDSVFIVEHFLMDREFDHKYILTNYVRKDIQRDLLLLENQLPFWVLRDLFHNMTVPTAKDDSPFTDFVMLTHSYFASLYLYPPSFLELARLKRDHVAFHHLVDFVRRYCVPLKRLLSKEEMFHHHPILQVSASKLYEAGVSFERVVHGSLIDITFETKKPFNGNLLCLDCFPSSCCQYFKALLVFPWPKLDNVTATVLNNLEFVWI